MPICGRMHSIRLVLTQPLPRYQHHPYQKVCSDYIYDKVEWLASDMFTSLFTENLGGAVCANLRTMIIEKQEICESGCQMNGRKCKNVPSMLSTTMQIRDVILENINILKIPWHLKNVNYMQWWKWKLKSILRKEGILNHIILIYFLIFIWAWENAV